MCRANIRKYCLPMYHPFYYITWSLRFTGIILGSFLALFSMFSIPDPCLSSYEPVYSINQNSIFMSVTALTLYVY